MKKPDDPKYNPHKLQKIVNDQLDRGALAITLKVGDEIQCSNGITLIYKQKRSGGSAMIVALIPREVRIYWGKSE